MTIQHKIYQQRIKDDMEEKRGEGMNVKLPKKPKNSEETLNNSWIKIQNIVFDKKTGLGIIKSGQSDKRPREKGGYKWLDA